MLPHCCNRLFVAFALPKSLCRLIDHKYPLLLLLHPFHTLFANCIFGMDIPSFLIDTHTFTYAWLSLTEIMLPQMCELLMSFSQLATWAILPVCQFAVGSSPQLPVAGFSSFSCCNFHKFLELCMCLSTCVCVSVYVCTLIIFTWQMLRFKCSSSNNICTYAQPAQPHSAASRTGKWIQLNPSAGPILRNETVYYATYRQIRIYTYVSI